MTSTITSKGQVTVPKKFRDYLGLKAGAAVEFSLGPHGEVVVRPAAESSTHRGKGRFSHLRGTLDTEYDTDALMTLLRGYDTDAHDPGLE